MRAALVVSSLLVAGAPFLGEGRRLLATTLPGQYLWIVNGVVALAGVLVLGAAVRRIRVGWPWRAALVGAAAIIAVVFTRMTGSPVPSVAAVEHFHFVQYGVITGLFYRAWRDRGDMTSLFWPVAAAMVCGTAEEWWQWFLPGRVGELADVLLNVVAIVCGLLVSVALAPLSVSPRDVVGRGWTRALGALGGAALVVAAFTWTVHVGHEISDDRFGRFVSRYSAAQLDVLAAERTTRWAADPPLARQRLTREDQYRSEGEAHARARNAAWDSGDVATAWRENLILERYYAPVLDTPSFIAPTGHRWHPDHRADAERRFLTMSPPPGPFRSQAVVDTKWTR
jgi:VanZ family protein